jgi:putative phage-type endonuclease
MTTTPFLCEQRTDEWRQARAGKVTASAIDAVLSTPKKGSTETAGRVNYRAQLIAEILTGKPVEDEFCSRQMQWGIDCEPFARAAYELQQDVSIETVGFVLHPVIECFGASPDGFIGDEGLVQFKCPNTATHLGYLLRGEVPTDYQPQMLAEMACTGRQWCDFVSFDPRLPPHLQLFVRRFQRNEKHVAEIEQKVEAFLDEVHEMLVRLSCIGDLTDLLQASVEQAKAKRGPQPIVYVMDRRNDDEVQGAD